MRRILSLALLCCLLSTTAVLAGSVTGTVTYDDKVPPNKALKMDADPACAKKHDAAVYSERLVLGDGNTMANILVAIKNAPAGGSVPSDPVVVDQQGCMYVPHVVGMMAGQELKFLNSDGIMHNVHGLPKANREFNIGMPPSVTEKVITLSKPEDGFTVKCDVHPWMVSYVAVLDHPYFSVTGTDGKFEIADVPDGTYEVVAWHSKLGERTGSVTVSGGAASLDFTFKLPKR